MDHQPSSSDILTEGGWTGAQEAVFFNKHTRCFSSKLGKQVRLLYLEILYYIILKTLELQKKLKLSTGTKTSYFYTDTELAFWKQKP